VQEAITELGSPTQRLFVIFYLKYLTEINKFLVPKMN